MSFNLPPDCSVRDIDRAAGAYSADCERCGCWFQACELNDVGLCGGCQREEERPKREEEEMEDLENE